MHVLVYKKQNVIKKKVCRRTNIDATSSATNPPHSPKRKINQNLNILNFEYKFWISLIACFMF